MPRATVRAAIADYLTSQQIPFVGAVFAHAPKTTTQGDFDDTQLSTVGSGAVIYVFLGEQSEERIRLIGNQLGGKQRTYKVSLICILQSKKRNAQDADADNDTFLDSLVGAIQASRTAGTTGAVFQWGEGDTVGGVDISIRAEMPRINRYQMTQIFSIVEVIAIEMNT